MKLDLTAALSQPEIIKEQYPHSFSFSSLVLVHGLFSDLKEQRACHTKGCIGDGATINASLLHPLTYTLSIL